MVFGAAFINAFGVYLNSSRLWDSQYWVSLINYCLTLRVCPSNLAECVDNQAESAEAHFAVIQDGITAG